MNIKILDCTIRDGSYVVDFAWKLAEVAALVESLDNAGLDYIEVGHGLGLGAYRSIPSLHTDQEYLDVALSNRKRSRVGVFFIPGIGTKEDLAQFKSCGGDFVRIGTNVNESNRAIEYIDFARNLGLEVGYNFMKSYAVSVFEICSRSQQISSAGASSISIVDSAGGMMPKQVTNYVSCMCDCVDIPVGFHGHNNLLLANANTLAAGEAGASILDCTLMGIGRGSGNAQLESMVMILKKSGFKIEVDPFSLSRISREMISSRVQNLKGANTLELTLGYAQFHDSYLKAVEFYANKYDIDIETLIIEISKVNKVNPSANLMEQIAFQSKKNSKVNFVFPKYYSQKLDYDKKRLSD